MKSDSPGWREIVGAQAWDLGLFAAFTALALVSFFRKSVTLKYVTFAASVIYLGFVKSQLISIVNVFALVDWNLPIFKYSLAWYLLAVFTVLVDGVVGPALLRPHVRVRRADAADGRDRAGEASLRGAAEIERRASTVKYVVLGARSCISS